MAKEKHLKFEQETKDLTFYYEIVGIISLIIPVLAFARLGLIGFYIMLIFFTLATPNRVQKIKHYMHGIICVNNTI